MSSQGSDQRNYAIILMGLGLDVCVLILAGLKQDFDYFFWIFAALVVGWMLSLVFLNTYKTRKPKKKLILFLIIHIIPLSILLLTGIAR